MKKSLLFIILLTISGLNYSSQLFAQSVQGSDEGTSALSEEELEIDVLKEMMERLNELSSISMDDLSPANISLVDYEIARKTLQHGMKISVKKYFNTLEQIRKEVVKTLQELVAIKKFSDQNSNNQLLLEEYKADVKLKIPALNSKINSMYQAALTSLLNLDNNAIIGITNLNAGFSKTPAKNISSKVSFKERIYGICESRICLKRIAGDILDWHQFVRHMNQEVNFVSFNGKNVWTKAPINTSPLINLALVQAAKDVLEVGLKENKDYSLPAIVAKAGQDIIRVPTGAALMVLSIPGFMIEKSAKVIADVLNFRLMKATLRLDPLKLYDLSTVSKGFTVQIAKEAEKLGSAAFINPETNQDEFIIQEKIKHSKKAIKIYLDLTQLTNDLSNPVVSEDDKKNLYGDLILANLFSVEKVNQENMTCAVIEYTSGQGRTLLALRLSPFNLGPYNPSYPEQLIKLRQLIQETHKEHGVCTVL